MKRSRDAFEIGTMSQTNTVKKSERTHEENQERAYIAASRRQDRSIEARIQSARQASEIHFKRTGKRFKITEEIVVNEEMYEEEEDESHRIRHALLNYPYPSTVAERVGAYAASTSHIAKLHEQALIDQQFAECFPGVYRPRPPQQFGQHIHTQQFQDPNRPVFHHYPVSPQQHHGGQQYPSPVPPPTHRRDRTQSMAQLTPRVGSPFIPQPQAFSLPRSRHGSIDDRSPPALTPGSTRTETPTFAETPPQGLMLQYPAAPSHLDHHQTESTGPTVGIPQAHSDPCSPFTSELPNNAKGILGLDMDMRSQMMMPEEDGAFFEQGFYGSPFAKLEMFEDGLPTFDFGSIPMHPSGTPVVTKREATDYTSIGFSAAEDPQFGGIPSNGQDDSWLELLETEALGP